MSFGARPTFQAQSLSSLQTTSRNAEPTQHTEITHPHNVKSKLAFHKVASFHQHYSTCTLCKHIQPPRAPVQVMAYADDITITSTSTSAATYIRQYLHKVGDWTKQNNLTLHPDKTTCTLFTPDPAEYKSIKGSGLYLGPKTHIHHTYSQHLSTSTQSTINDKNTHSKSMG